MTHRQGDSSAIIRRHIARSGALALLTLLALGAIAQRADAATHIKSDITVNTTWTASGSPYLLDTQVKVASGITLTIQPGVKVEFNAGPTLTLFIAGHLEALGTEANPITFTSSQEETGTPAPGQYKGLTVLGTGASAKLSYAKVTYGGIGSGGLYNYGVIRTQTGAALEVDHSTFEYNEYSGILLAGTGSTTVSYSQFSHNGNGISQVSISPGPLTLSHNRITENAEDGLFFDFGEKSTSPGASVVNNEIHGNEGTGIHLWASCSSPSGAFPHGNGNDIYGNGSGADGSELKTLYPCEALPIDWTGNYWGSVEFIEGPEPLLLRGFVCEGLVPKEWYGGASVQPSGYLAYSGWAKNALNPPPGPISTSSYSTPVPMLCPDKTVATTTYKNVSNSIYLDPEEISTEFIPIT
jgi:hypothetical protein